MNACKQSCMHYLLRSCFGAAKFAGTQNCKMVTFAQYYWSPACAKLFAIKQNQQNRSAIKHNLLTCANNRACITLFCSGFGSAKFAGTQNCKMVTSAQYFSRLHAQNYLQLSRSNKRNLSLSIIYWRMQTLVHALPFMQWFRGSKVCSNEDHAEHCKDWACCTIFSKTRTVHVAS